MPMKKDDRKKEYMKVITHMAKCEHKEAYAALTSMMGSDIGLFILAEYEAIVEANKPKHDDTSNG
jgi:hypothetical protein